jgi:GNAT superfamily N-acetyltransferase
MPPIITLHRDVDLLPEDNASIERWITAMFPWDGDHPDEGEFYAPYYFFRVWEDEAAQTRGEWASLVALTDRTISVGGQPVRVGGIGAVSTREDRRERGYASLAMREAARFMFDNLGVPFGMLFCDPHRIPFYESLGWQVIRTPIPAHNEAHFLILAPDKSPWPIGDVDLLGPSW